MAISKFEARRREVEALKKDTGFNPEVNAEPILPVGSDKVIKSEFEPITQKYKAFLKDGKERHKGE